MTDSQSAFDLDDEHLPEWTSPSKITSSIIAPDDALLRWAHRMGQRGIPFEAAGREERERGRRVHDISLLYARRQLAGEPLNLVEPLGERPGVRGYLEALNLWWTDRQPHVVAAELRVVDEHRRLRGDIDLVTRCPGMPWCTRDWCNGDGAPDGPPGVWIVDYKTNKLDTLKNHLTTGGLYPLMWSAVDSRPVCRRLLVGLNLEGHSRVYVELDAACDERDATAALRWYRTGRDGARRAHAAAAAAAVARFQTPSW